VFERYKMRSRIDLLKNMSSASWSTVVSTVLSRGGDKTWTKGREKVGDMGPDWLRSRLVREGRELVRRYDQLLPVEPRKYAQITHHSNEANSQKPYRPCAVRFYHP